jgi:hypothetical protein
VELMKLEPEFASGHAASLRLIEAKFAVEDAIRCGRDTYQLWIEAEEAFLDKLAADHRTLLAVARRGADAA